MKKDKKLLLSYIEETRKHFPLIEEVIKGAVDDAIKLTKKNFVDITYLLGDELIKESPSGEKTVIEKLDLKKRKVDVGSKTKL